MVLVVDDHADIAHAMVALLKCHGIEAKCVFSGETALAAIADCSPQLIVLDDFMPAMTGLDVLTALKADTQLTHILVLFHSAGQSLERRQRAMDLGATRWFDKGEAAWDEIPTLIRKLLG